MAQPGMVRVVRAVVLPLRSCPMKTLNWRPSLPQSLRARIVVGLIFVGLVPILVALSLNIMQSSGTKEVVDSHLRLLIEHTADGVRQSLERGGILTRMVAQDPAFRSDMVDRAALENRLVYFNGLLPQFHHLTLVDSAGNVLASSTYNYYGTWQVREVFHRASAGQAAISPAHMTLRSREPAVTFAAPVEGSEGEVKGIVVGELSIGSITNLAIGLKVGERGHTSVVNSLGQIIADSDPDQLMRTRTVVQVCNRAQRLHIDRGHR